MTACVIIQLTGARTERLLNRMREDGISAFAIRRAAPGTVELTMRARDFPRLHLLARGAGCRVRIVKKTGPAFGLLRLFRRKTLWIGSLLLLLLLALASTRILWIEVSGCTRVAEQTVLRALAAEGLGIGADNRSWNLPELNNRLRTYDERIAFVGLAVDGVILRVRIVETAVKNDAGEADAPADIVAQKGGVITRIVERSGRAAVAIGDVVQPGDLLIRGELTTEASQYPLVVHAAGQVLAHVVYLSEAVAEPEETVLADSGRSVPYRAVSLAGLRLSESEIPYAEFALRELRTVTVTDLLLPLTVTEGRCYEQTEQQRRRTVAEMAEAALYEAEQNAYLKIPGDAAVVEKRGSWMETDGRVLAVVSVMTEESIGLTKELSVDGNQ